MRISKVFYSIRWRIAMSYTLLIVLALGIVAFSVSQVVSTFLLRQRIAQQQLLVDQFAIEVSQPLKSSDASALYQAALRTGQNNGGRVIIVDTNGIVQVDAYSRLNGSFAGYKEIAMVLWNNYPKAHDLYQNISDQGNLFTAKKTWLAYYSNQIVYDGELIGAALFSIPIQDIMDQTNDIMRKILLIFAGAIVVALILSAILSASLTKPINELSTAISLMGSGQLSQKAKVSGNTEFLQLANTFNDMSERLEHMDILRSEFVSNASHEIKTPLATMKILIESLLYQDDFDPIITKEFLSDVNSEIDRMTLVIGDLLNLVKIDQTQQSITVAKASIDTLITDAINRITPIAKERGITIQSKLAHVKADIDSTKLQQVLQNIIDNAIKYSDRDTVITIDLYTAGANFIIKVSDQGYGIPESDLPHIFERFYRVDKARSRETGGTGLGLSIVERIIKLHNGTIHVRSKEGEGTEFTITMPIERKQQL